MLYNNILDYEEKKVDIYTQSILLNFTKDIKRLINDVSFLVDQNEFMDWHQPFMAKNISLYERKTDIVESVYLADKLGNIKFKSSKRNNYVLNEKEISDEISDNSKKYFSTFLKNNKLYILLKYPIYNRFNEVTGFLISVFHFDNSNIDIFKSIIDPENFKWEILLTNEKGLLIYDTHKKIQGNGIFNIDYSKHPAVMNALLGKWELSLVKINDEYFYTSSEVITETGWILILIVPRVLVIMKVLKIILPNVILIILLLSGIFVFMWFRTSNIMKPVVNLTSAMKEYGDKGNAAFLETKDDSEISVAIRTFNKMVLERKELDKEIFQIIERERKRVGKELHEELEKILSGIYNQYLIVREELNKLLKLEDFYVLSYLEKISLLLNTAINKTKAISNGLCPVNLYEGGFIKSIKEVIKSLENDEKIVVMFNYEENISMPGEMALLNLYYIIQEAFRDAVNHHAKKIEFSLSRKNESIIISVYDNRTMLFEDTENKMSRKIMNYSARLINAELKFEENGVVCILKIVSNL